MGVFRYTFNSQFNSNTSLFKSERRVKVHFEEQQSSEDEENEDDFEDSEDRSTFKTNFDPVIVS